jgi:hypothetical protein
MLRDIKTRWIWDRGQKYEVGNKSREGKRANERDGGCKKVW